MLALEKKVFVARPGLKTVLVFLFRARPNRSGVVQGLVVRSVSWPVMSLLG